MLEFNRVVRLGVLLVRLLQGSIFLKEAYRIYNIYILLTTDEGRTQRTIVEPLQYSTMNVLAPYFPTYILPKSYFGWYTYLPTGLFAERLS